MSTLEAVFFIALLLLVAAWLIWKLLERTAKRIEEGRKEIRRVEEEREAAMRVHKAKMEALRARGLTPTGRTPMPFKPEMQELPRKKRFPSPPTTPFEPPPAAGPGYDSFWDSPLMRPETRVFESGGGGEFAGGGATGGWATDTPVPTPFVPAYPPPAPAPAPAPAYDPPLPAPVYEAPAPSPSPDAGASSSGSSDYSS